MPFTWPVRTGCTFKLLAAEVSSSLCWEYHPASPQSSFAQFSAFLNDGCTYLEEAVFPLRIPEPRCHQEKWKTAVRETRDRWDPPQQNIHVKASLLWMFLCINRKKYHQFYINSFAEASRKMSVELRWEPSLAWAYPNTTHTKERNRAKERWNTSLLSPVAVQATGPSTWEHPLVFFTSRKLTLEQKLPHRQMLSQSLVFCMCHEDTGHVTCVLKPSGSPV